MSMACVAAGQAGGARRARTDWGEGRLAFLVESYANVPASVIAAALQTNERAVYAKARVLGLKKSEDFLSSVMSGRITRGSTLGSGTTFKVGQTPHNKGRKVQAHANSVKTQFKEGEKPKNWQPIGTERMNGDGYLVRKVSETGVQRQDWQPVHRLNWEAASGSIPKGMVLVFKDGNKGNPEVSNLELVTRGELMKRNAIHKWPKELAEVMRLMGRVRKAINECDAKCD